MIKKADLHEGQLRTWVNGAFRGKSFIVLQISMTIENSERGKVCKILEGESMRTVFFDVVRENSYVAA